MPWWTRRVDYSGDTRGAGPTHYERAYIACLTPTALARRAGAPRKVSMPVAFHPPTVTHRHPPSADQECAKRCTRPPEQSPLLSAAQHKRPPSLSFHHFPLPRPSPAEYTCTKRCACPEDGAACALEAECLPGTVACLNGKQLVTEPQLR